MSASCHVAADQIHVAGAAVSWEEGPRFREEWRGVVSPAEARLSVQLGEDTLTLDTSAPSGQSPQRRVLGPALASLRFRPAPASEETRRVLEEELGNCEQLLELEPESKWPHYTRALIMLALDSRHHHQEIVSCLERLQEVDPLRRRYYQDQRSKLIIEYLLESAAPDFQTIDLSPHKLSKIYHRQYLNICAEVRW